MSTLRNPADTDVEAPAPQLPRAETSTPIFVDASGRRQRWVRRSAVAAMICLVGYLAVAGVLLVVRPGVSPLPLPGLSSDTGTAPAAPVHKQPAPVRHTRTTPTTAVVPTQPVPSSPFAQTQPTPRPSQPASSASARQTAPPTSQPSPTDNPTHDHTPPGLAKASGTPPGWSHKHAADQSAGNQQGQN